MAKVLNYEAQIGTGQVIQPWHISQSVDAFTGAEAYDITISGSLVTTGSIEGTTTLTIGSNHTNTGTCSSIGGGSNNNASGNRSIIGGGIFNCTSFAGSTVSGGCGNTACNNGSTIGGGNNNISSGCVSTVAGGRNNSSTSTFSTIGGGCNNLSCAIGSIVAGGTNNWARQNYSGVLGGRTNKADHSDSFIIGSNLTSDKACTTFMNNVHITGSTTTDGILQLSRRTTTPTGVEGMIISSGSAGASKLYYFNGSTWNALF